MRDDDSRPLHWGRETLQLLDRRVPAVLAGESISLEDQLAQWEERKALEKAARDSCMDDIPTATPALLLAQKVIARVRNAGLPADLIPASIASVSVDADTDAENELRTAVMEFMDMVRSVERAVLTGRGDIGGTVGVADEDEWRRHWPPH